MYCLQLVLFVTFTVFVGTSAGEVVGRIIGGHDANIADHPYQVLIQGPRGSRLGGSIIAKDVVLTTAHSLANKSPKDFTIQYGLTCIGGSNNWIKAKRLIIHKQFSFERGENDIALIILKRAIPLGATAQIIPLATETPAPGTHVIVSGWGVTDLYDENSISDHLQSLTVQVVSLETCRRRYIGTRLQANNHVICVSVTADGGIFHRGDSGGPVVADGRLVGIISWTAGTGRATDFGVCTNIAEMRDWILEKIRNKAKCAFGICF